jgi:ribosomal protein S18 acetylase RimI-like enzyme
MDVITYENEAESFQKTKSSISILNLQSFNNDILLDSFTKQQEIINFSDLKINTSMDIVFSNKFSNKQFIQIKKQFLLLFKVTYPEEFFKKIFERKYHTIIGLEEESKELVCFGIIELNTTKKLANILALGVVKEYQNKGVGSRFFQKILEELTNTGIHQVALIVQKTNTNALKLYNKFGLTCEEELPNYYYYLEGEESKAYLMQKNIIKKQFWVFNVFRKITEKLLMSKAG